MAKIQEIDTSKNYRATLIEGLVYNLGLRRFDRGQPQKVDGKLAAVLVHKHYMSDLQKANKKVEAVPVYYFDLEVIEADEEAQTAEVLTSEGEGEGEGNEDAAPKAAPKKPRSVARATA